MISELLSQSRRSGRALVTALVEAFDSQWLPRYSRTAQVLQSHDAAAALKSAKGKNRNQQK